MFKTAEIRGFQTSGQAPRKAASSALGLGFALLAAACSGGSEVVGGRTQGGNSGNNNAGYGGGVDNPFADPSGCAHGSVGTTRLTPHVILVLDGSCSMSTNYPANGAESASSCTNNENGRWAALRRALIDPTNGVVSKLQHAVQFGAVVYGTAPMCPIPGQPVRPAINNLTAVEAAIPRVQPGMFTPTGPALDWVYENLIEGPQPDGDNAQQIVILATDGEPNSCGGGRGGGGGGATNYQPSIDAVTKGTKLGVTTYVISLADSAGAFHDHLQQLADLGNPIAGGKAKLYEPTSPAELSADLETLIGGAVSCDIALNGQIEAGAECNGTVKLNGIELGCNKPDGFILLDARHIRIQGASCQKLLNDKAAVINANFPCNSFSPD